MHEGLSKYPFRVTVYQRGNTGSKDNIKHFNAETVGQARGIQLQWINARFTEKVEISLIIDTWTYTAQERGDQRPYMERKRATARANDPGAIRSFKPGDKE
jgi:hypothetical protein